MPPHSSFEVYPGAVHSPGNSPPWVLGLVSRETVLYHPRLLCGLLKCSLGITVISPILQLKGAGPRTPDSPPHPTPLPHLLLYLRNRLLTQYKKKKTLLITWRLTDFLYVLRWPSLIRHLIYFLPNITSPSTNLNSIVSTPRYKAFSESRVQG